MLSLCKRYFCYPKLFQFHTFSSPFGINFISSSQVVSYLFFVKSKTVLMLSLCKRYFCYPVLFQFHTFSSPFGINFISSSQVVSYLFFVKSKTVLMLSLCKRYFCYPVPCSAHTKKDCAETQSYIFNSTSATNIMPIATCCLFVIFSLKQSIPTRLITTIVATLYVGYATTAGTSPTAFNRKRAEK